MKQNRFPRLVGYELRKAFGSPWMLAFLVLLLLTNLWKLKDEYDKKTAFRQTYAPVYEDFYGRWKGEILPEFFYITVRNLLLRQREQKGFSGYNRPPGN